LRQIPHILNFNGEGKTVTNPQRKKIGETNIPANMQAMKHKPRKIPWKWLIPMAIKRKNNSKGVIPITNKRNAVGIFRLKTEIVCIIPGGSGSEIVGVGDVIRAHFLRIRKNPNSSKGAIAATGQYSEKGVVFSSMSLCS